MKLQKLFLLMGMMISTTAFAMPAATMPAKATAPTANFTPAQQQAIENIVHQYLTAHPEVLMEMAQTLQVKQMAQMQEKAKGAISKLIPSLLNDPTSPVEGNAKATLSVVEFFDYQCPHCKAMEPEMAALLAHNPNIRIIYKELPIFGPDSEFAAKAALASVKQGKFVAMNSALLKAQERLTNDVVLKIAGTVGLDVKKLQTDMQDPAYAKEFSANQALAAQIGMAGTPAFVIINNKAGVFTSQYIPGQTNEAGLQKALDVLK